MLLHHLLFPVSSPGGKLFVVSPNMYVLFTSKQITSRNRYGLKPSVVLMGTTQFFKQAFNKSLIPFHLFYELCVWLCVCVLNPSAASVTLSFWMLVDTQQVKRMDGWDSVERREEEKWGKSKRERCLRDPSRDFVALFCVWDVKVRMQCQHSLTRKRRFITSQWYLTPWQDGNVRIPLTHGHAHKHRCTLMCWLCVCCDRHGGAGCRFFCLALRSMSLTETRRDRGASSVFK